MKKQRGITLVALIITIIVLLILAGVTINLTLGERGIFSTAQKATENYKTAQEKEFASLNSFENEMNDTIDRMNRMSTKITSANYGDKVNYSANGETDWKIFYNDGANVYLILSGYLPYSKVPNGAEMTTIGSRPYAAYWRDWAPIMPSAMQDTTNYGLFRPQIEGVTTSYSLNSSNQNSKCVSTLANTNNWTSLVNTTYADYAIGSPTIEMWIASWNEKGYTKLYCNNTNEYGYYVGTSTSPTGNYVHGLSTSDKLYFPIDNSVVSDANGYHYWLSSPSATGSEDLLLAVMEGNMHKENYGANYISVRPVVRLKSTTTGEKVNGVWQLK